MARVPVYGLWMELARASDARAWLPRKPDFNTSSVSYCRNFLYYRILYLCILKITVLVVPGVRTVCDGVYTTRHWISH
jgi:hypothetical protein